MNELFFALKGLHAVAEGVLILLLAAAIYGVLNALLPVRSSALWTRLPLRGARKKRSWVQRLLGVPGPEHNKTLSLQNVLHGCGLRWEAGRYLAAKRATMLAAACIGLSLMDQTLIFLLAVAVIFLGMLDRYVLDKVKQLRRQRIMQDVDALSRQLLYYSDYNANFHSKLMRTLPLAAAIKDEWYKLAGEWYQGAEYALRRFRERLATEEAASFAETINALRQYDNDRYYHLLKERIADYKEKLELIREGRKEAISYLLFVISGIPILYTFRLFIYPWVAEGQKLFQSLG